MAFSSWSKHRQTWGALRQRSRACRHVRSRDVISLSRLEQKKIIRRYNIKTSHLHSKESPFFSPDDIHGMLFSWGRGERSEAHHLGWVPERLFQVASLNVSLKVCQPQHGQVHRVCGDTWQARPLLLGSHNPVIMGVSVMFIILEVIACGVWIWDCVGLKKQGRFKTGRV